MVGSSRSWTKIKYNGTLQQKRNLLCIYAILSVLPHLVSPFSLARPHLVYVLKKSRPLAFRPRSRVQLIIWLAIDRIIKSRNQCCKINTTIREMGKSQKRKKKERKREEKTTGTFRYRGWSKNIQQTFYIALTNCKRLFGHFFASNFLYCSQN